MGIQDYRHLRLRLLLCPRMAWVDMVLPLSSNIINHHPNNTSTSSRAGQGILRLPLRSLPNHNTRVGGSRLRLHRDRVMGIVESLVVCTAQVYKYLNADFVTLSRTSARGAVYWR